MKAIDLIFLTLIVFALVFVWTGNYIDVGLALVLSVAITALALVTIVYFIRQKSKPYDKDRLALELSVKGSGYLVEILKSILKNAVFESGSNWILLESALIIACFRFSLVGLNDVGNFYSLALEKDRKQVFLLCRGIDRKAVYLLEAKGIKISVIKIKGIYDFLARNSALPALEKEKRRFPVKKIFSLLLSRSNAKNYLLVGIVLLTTAFLTPFKIYYLVFGSISLFLALLTLTPLGNGDFGSNSSFNALIDETEKVTLPSRNENDDSDKE